jgi:YtcA-like protein
MTPIADKSPPRRKLFSCLALAFIAALTGCQRAPSFNIAGSFFPDWIFCCLIGILLAVVSYRLFVGLEMESDVQPAVLIYPCIALSSAVTLWLVIFG